MKEDMDVEPCYPFFSAELESAEALANSQRKFQTLYSTGPRHGDVRGLTEDWKVGPFVLGNGRGRERGSECTGGEG